MEDTWAPHMRMGSVLCPAILSSVSKPQQPDEGGLGVVSELSRGASGGQFL